jgi:hypothetical protein
MIEESYSKTLYKALQLVNKQLSNKEYANAQYDLKLILSAMEKQFNIK